MTSRRRFLVLGAGLAALVGAGVVVRLDRQVREAASEERVRERRFRPLAFAPLPRPATPLATLGDGRVQAAALVGGALWTAGGSGLSDGEGHVLDTGSGLPTLRAVAIASWRGTPVLALAQGGWGRVLEGRPEEATTGWGRLDVRTFLELDGGELLVGSRQGLFRAAPGAGELERLDASPVRALARLDGGRVAAGGETGLRLVSLGSGPAVPVAPDEPWVDALGSDAGTLWAATPAGIFSGPPGAALTRHPRGGDGSAGVAHGGRFWFVPSGETPTVASLRGDERREEATPERFSRLLVAGESLLADGPSGLFRRDPEHGWTRVAARPGRSLPAPHVNALAVSGTTIWAGFFDGGIATATGPDASWTPIADREPWGVNALLPGGGALYAATLRGAFRVEKGAVRKLEGTGGAYSLAFTESGLAVGYGQGVLLPEKRLLSAFHGLPGNQAYALARSSTGQGLWVGTPTGLGHIEGRRVVAAARPGEGKLPHPWVTALVPAGDTLLVATFGGGIALERGRDGWTRFPETAGLKVNAGALVVDRSGRAFAGTQGQGLWVSDTDRTRFTRLVAPLPSPNVFSLALYPEASPTTLLAGTDEGLALIPLPLQEN